MIAAIDAPNSYRRKAETACSSRSPLTSARPRDRDQLAGINLAMRSRGEIYLAGDDGLAGNRSAS
jgi:hypothetical protein